MTKRPTSRPQIDWLMVRAAFESGEFSDRALAREFKVTPKALRYRAAKESWRKPAQTARQSPVAPKAAAPPAPKPESEPPIALAVSPSLADASAAEPLALVARGRDLAGRLFDELHAATSHVGEIEELISEETAGDMDGGRRHAMLKAVSLPTRAAVLKNLALATRILSDAAPGKKATAEEIAKKAGTGRFTTPPGPKLVVNNT